MKHSLLRDSVYNEEYTTQLDQFNDTKLYKRLSRKYEIKPYYKENKGRYYVAIGSGYLFNLFSAFVGSYFLYSLLEGAVHFIVNLLCTVLLLIIIEYAKRSCFADVSKVYLQFRRVSKGAAILSALLLALSAFASYKGSARFIRARTAPVHVVNTDSIHTLLESKISPLKAQQIKLREIKYKGNTTRTAQRSIEKIQVEILALRESYKLELSEARAQNREVISTHADTKNTRSWLFSLLALFIDTAIIFCIVYAEYYDYRSLAEFSDTPSINALPSDKAEPKELMSDTSNKGSTAPVQVVPTCESCGSEYEMTRKNKRFCSTECRQEAYELRTGKQLRAKGL